MTGTILFTIVTLVALGLLFAVVLYFVAQKFKVEEDPRIATVESILPGANCGGCGQAGCHAFAENVVKAPSMEGFFCPVGGNPVMTKVAEALGRAVEEKAPMVAVMRCNGAIANRARTNEYDGYASCKVMASLYSGDTGCKFGCLGKGDCEAACQFDAIHVNPATGLCINKDKGAVTRKACSVGCIGCGKCAKTCPFGAISVENNVAYIDFTKCKMCRKCVEVCPTHAIHEVNFPPKPKIEPKPNEENV